jgi:hypothetical protein
MGGARSTYGEKRNAYTILVGMAEGKRQLEIPRRRCQDNITMDLKWGWRAWSSLILFRIGTSCGLL